MRIKILRLFAVSSLFFSCQDIGQGTTNETSKTSPQTDIQNKAYDAVYAMVQNVGNHDVLSKKQNVTYTYTYQTPDERKDVSIEKYIFDGELSYGRYITHQRTMPDLQGTIEQGYDGKTYWLKHEGQVISDEKLLKRVAFARPTNYYWFAMMQKLLDPGLTYDHVGETTINNKDYDVVKVSFDSEDGKPKDIYQVYINKETLLVDQFLFTVADFGVMEVPFLMQLEYEDVDGILIPTKRKYKKSTWNADVTEGPWTHVVWTDIKFNSGITKADFESGS